MSYNTKIDYNKEAKEGGQAIISGTASGASSGGLFGAIAGFLIGSVDAGFGWAKSGKEKEIEDERRKQEILGDIYKKPKKDWTPVIVVGSVLIVGAIVTYITLKEK